MKKLLLFATFFISLAHAGIDYYGAKSTEAILTFEGKIQVETSRKLSVEQINGRTPRALEIHEAVEYQLSYLIGHFQSASFVKSFRYPGVLSSQQNVQFKAVSEVVDGYQILSYKFKGKVNFQSAAFSHSLSVSVPLRIPLNPYTIFNYGMVGAENKCTDEHYDTEGDFFYFWDIEKAFCPLKKDKEQVLRLEGKIEKLQNTEATYPEFDRLYKTKDLTISIFLGYIDEVLPKRVKRSDAGYLTYKEIHAELKNQGFTLVDEKKKFLGSNFFARFEKDITNQLGFQQKIKLNMLLSDSELVSAKKTFPKYYQAALEDSQIVAYDGHSGLGGNLDLDRLEGLKLPSFYQIFFLNGCSSYPYFNQQYFSAKPGAKKNLEIITAGLPTMTTTSFNNMMAFLNPFLKGRILSYQTLLSNLEKSNLDEGTYLMGVNGDEDNKFQP